MEVFVMKSRKYAGLIYPYFSLQEITCLTSCLSIWFGEQLDIIGSEKILYTSEEGFQVMPTVTVDEVKISDYDCIILPGILNPLPALFDEKLIAFLRTGINTNVLFAAISSSPLLLSKAGILCGKDFTAGYFMQMTDIFPFIEKDHFVHKPVVEDTNVITAIGTFFREFAKQVLDRLGYDIGDNFMLPANRKYSENELTYYWSESDYNEFLEELKQYRN